MPRCMLLKYTCMHKTENTECYSGVMSGRRRSRLQWKWVKVFVSLVARRLHCSTACHHPCRLLLALSQRAVSYTWRHGIVMASSWHRGWIRFRKHLKSRQHSVVMCFAGDFRNLLFAEKANTQLLMQQAEITDRSRHCCEFVWVLV